ncbi:MAG TPA: Rieske (2Fe-2S) protein, partial [Amnibacterium sp.]|nr:Rieske (2Fe-2S) protein [Amnibacterium sp.]
MTVPEPQGDAAGVRVCGVDDLEVDTALRVIVGGTPVAVVRDSSGTIHAIGDTCTHGD